MKPIYTYQRDKYNPMLLEDLMLEVLPEPYSPYRKILWHQSSVILHTTCVAKFNFYPQLKIYSSLNKLSPSTF